MIEIFRILGLQINTTQGNDFRWIAWLESDPGIWQIADTQNEAICDLIMLNSERETLEDTESGVQDG